MRTRLLALASTLALAGGCQHSDKTQAEPQMPAPGTAPAKPATPPAGPAAAASHGSPDQHAAASLTRAYDRVAGVMALGSVAALNASLPTGAYTQVLNQAKQSYRDARHAYLVGDLPRSEELSRAAEAAGLGLEHALLAGRVPKAELPAPPFPPVPAGAKPGAQPPAPPPGAQAYAAPGAGKGGGAPEAKAGGRAGAQQGDQAAGAQQEAPGYAATGAPAGAQASAAPGARPGARPGVTEGAQEGAQPPGVAPEAMNGATVGASGGRGAAGDQADADRIREQLKRNQDHRQAMAARLGAQDQAAPFAQAAVQLYDAAQRALQSGDTDRAHLLAMASDDLLRAHEHQQRAQGGV